MKKYIIAAVLAILMASTAHAAKPIQMEDGTLYHEPKKLSQVTLTDDEYDLICRVVYLEAGGEGEELQRAVTEVILNRIKCGHWGKTVEEVIYAKDQFSVVPDIPKAEPSELTKTVVRDVFENGSSIPARVMFFRKDFPHQWCGAVTEFSVGNIWFSSSKWLKI